MNSTKILSTLLGSVRYLCAVPVLAALALAADPAAPTPAPAETPLHELGAAPSPAPAPSGDDDAHASRKHRPDYVVHQEDDDENRVAVNDSVEVRADEVVPGNAVAVMGPLKVDGTVNGNAVAVLGGSTINGTVQGNAVVVMGSLHVGPNAHIDGNAVAIGGVVTRAPGSYIGGHIVHQGSGFDFSEDSGAYSWWNHGMRLGRPLAFGPHLHVFWLLSICTIALYVLLSLMFPAGIVRCGEMIVHRPGITILTGILAIIALPVVFILLCVTVVGIPIAFVVLPIAIVAFLLFGKAAVYSLIGRSILRSVHPALGALIGALVVACFYLVPFFGGMLWVLIAFLGFSAAVSSLFISRGAGAPPPPAPPAPSAPPAPAAAAPAAPAEAAGAAPVPPQSEQAPAAATPPPVIPLAVAAVARPLSAASEAALPKAGFWVRIVALLIDFILVGIVVRMHDWLPVALATYGAILWKLRGATVGDIIFGIKVVRMDGAPIEWVTAIVRALGCFFSIVVVGLGFIWIAFDADKQAWHDKIAGTVVVKLPKGSSLV
ncbi:MAG TPA: RDD family protein [Opitutaceae bacterium]|jgi:uncharacterized RDD family membrane protein YckC